MPFYLERLSCCLYLSPVSFFTVYAFVFQQSMSSNPSQHKPIQGILYDESYALIRVIKNAVKYNLSIAKLLIVLEQPYPIVLKTLFLAGAKFLYIINSIGTFFSLLLLGNFYSKYDIIYNLFEEGQPIYHEIKKIGRFFFSVFAMIFTKGGEVEEEENEEYTEAMTQLSAKEQELRTTRKIFKIGGWIFKTLLFMLVLPIYLICEKILHIRQTAMVLLIVFILMMYTAGGGLAYNDFFSIYSLSLVFVMCLFTNTSLSITSILILSILSYFHNPAYFYVAYFIDFSFGIVLISSVMASNIINTLIPKLFETKLTIQQAFSLDDKAEEVQDKEVLQVTESNLGFDKDEIKMMEMGFQVPKSLTDEVNKRSLWKSILLRMKDHKLSIREILDIYAQIEVLKADIIDWFRMKYNLCQVDESNVDSLKERYNELSHKYEINIDKQLRIKGITDKIFSSLMLASALTALVYFMAISNVVFGQGIIAYFSRGIIDLDIAYQHWIMNPYLYNGTLGYVIYSGAYLLIFFITFQALGGSVGSALKVLLGFSSLALMSLVIIVSSGISLNTLLLAISNQSHLVSDLVHFLNDTLLKNIIFGISYCIYGCVFVLHYLLNQIVSIIELISFSQFLQAILIWGIVSLLTAITIGPIVGIKIVKWYSQEK